MNLESVDYVDQSLLSQSKIKNRSYRSQPQVLLYVDI